jgi:hypothetical protein
VTGAMPALAVRTRDTSAPPSTAGRTGVFMVYRFHIVSVMPVLAFRGAPHPPREAIPFNAGHERRLRAMLRRALRSIKRILTCSSTQI